jgi:hypothetical protein
MPTFTFDPVEHRYWLTEGSSRVELPSVTTVLAGCGMIDTSQYRMKKLADGREIDPRTFGQYVHSACHMDWKGTLDEDTLDAALLPYVEAFRAFRAATPALTIVGMEQPNYHHTYQYAGTPDIFGLWDGAGGIVPCIIDIKAGGKEPWHQLQSAAYALMINGNHYCNRAALYLDDDGRFNLDPHQKRQDGQIFLSALAVYNWKRNNGGIK